MLSRRILFSSCLVVTVVGALVAVGAPAPERLQVKDGPLGMKFVSLPKGTFYQGWVCPRVNEKELANERETGIKVKKVQPKGQKTEIKEAFEIAIHTVTQGHWQGVMGSNPSSFSRKGKMKHRVADIKDEELNQFPVETVSWDDAQDFIKKLNEQNRGRGWLYRLPREAEWEYACRAGATTERECECPPSRKACRFLSGND